MLYNGEEIAVERLSTNSGQGDPEFTNEVSIGCQTSTPKFSQTLRVLHGKK